MAKCGACGKFAAVIECIRCTKCSASYHLACVGLPATAKASPNWLCPGCKAKMPKEDNSATPVKSVTFDCSTDNTSGTAIPPSTVSKVTTAPVELDVAHEIRCFREELGAMRLEFQRFQEELLSLKTSVGTYNQRMDTFETKVSNIEKRFEELGPAHYDNLEATISELKVQLNERDQDSLQNDLVITGIPETKEENPHHIIKIISVKLGVTLDEKDVVNVERIGAVRRNFIESDNATPPRPRVIAVRLVRRALRDQLLKAARVRRGLTTTDLDLHGQPRKFYINERLTPANGKLFYNAREAGQRFKYRYVWTKDGRIYARKEDGATAQRIRCDSDLVRIFGNDSV